MNFSQLHERVRLELLRRIEREVLTASLLAQKTGMRQPHISNFLRSKRRLSLPALDRVLSALGLSVADLIVTPQTRSRAPVAGIPLISQQAAMHQDLILGSSAGEHIYLPAATLGDLRAEHGVRGPTRDRFVAIGITVDQARSMEPLLRGNAIVVLDRHSTAPLAWSSGSRHIYAVRREGQIHFSYLSYEHNLLVLRPHLLEFPVIVLPIPPQSGPSDFIVGRVCAIVSSL